MGLHLNPLLFEEQHLVRIVDRNGEPWFVGSDVATILGHRDAQTALRGLEEDEKGTHILRTPGGDQEVLVVSEAGVYQLVFTSRKEVALRLKRWLAHEVIPAIRRDGFYKARRPDAASVEPEARPFPEWPMDELRTKRGVVDMYRMLYGTMAAQWISPQVGFPSPPMELVENGRQFTLTLVANNTAA